MHKPLFVFSMLFSSAAFAAPDEDQVRYTNHELVLSTGNAVASVLGTHAGLSLGYHLSLTDAIQVGMVPTVQYADGGLWDVSLIGVMTYNFFADKGLHDSPFFSLAAGARYYRFGADRSTNAILQATAGKRFELFQGVNYRPSISVIRQGSFHFVRLDFFAFSLTF